MFSFLRVKWLKIWAQEISQAEMELGITQSLFARQSQNARQILEGIGNIHINHMRSLADFVEAQAFYFAQCHQHAQELQRQLASIPAVLCSNNWQSASSNGSNQASVDNRAANESIRSNQVTSLPIVVHHLPDFDQDSWTTNPQTGTENTLTDSFIPTQSPGQTNNNNNNNILTDVQLACPSSSDLTPSADQPLNVAAHRTLRHTLTLSAMTTPGSQHSQLSTSVDGAAAGETAPTSDSPPSEGVNPESLSDQ
ncbi:endophilin-B2-like [Betta splendens]|uniref:Endophilin-B2-like n=1 Tax=Betta splendens TaxID=158456 RepID=A0A9W2XII3_BETSP|nr:endophilin-B2-like [Betta splendens]